MSLSDDQKNGFVTVLLVLCVGLWQVKALSGHGTYVMNLDNRFDEMKGNNPYLLQFYAPWCGHCKKLEPVYERVGGKLDGTGIYVAKIDATRYRDVAEKYDIAGFPSILYVHGDRVVEYHGDRTAEDISRFAIRCRREPIVTMHSIGSLKDRLRQSAEEAFFVYVGEQSHHLFSEFSATAKNYSIYVDFYKAESKALAKEVGDDMKLPVVLVYKDSRRYQFNPMVDSSLSSWVDEERYSALQPSQGFAMSTLMRMDKMLIIIVAQESSDEPEIKANSKQALERARPTALNRNLKQFQFVIMESTATVSGILMTEVSVPYAIAFHPQTQVFYTTEQPPHLMNSDDWVDFLSGIITSRLQPQGGQGFLVKMKRALYGLRSSLLELWMESRVIFGVVVIIPMFVISLVIYMLCCASWGEEGEVDDISDEEDDDGQSAGDKASGHLKSD
ncbi:protein disulfide-isomerase TMX3-like [Watersipora subatra]|uniref:protein disulfide-isomerase TMX3-like n=1 Tax=Watersipora subatra TaxID=2589382 RepID=UPI00355B240B